VLLFFYAVANNFNFEENVGGTYMNICFDGYFLVIFINIQSYYFNSNGNYVSNVPNNANIGSILKTSHLFHWYEL